MSSQQPILQYPVATGAEPIVNEAYDKWSAIALQAFALAEQLASEIGNFPISPVSFNASFDPQAALPGFVAPTPPTTPTDLAFVPPPDVPDPPVVDLGSYTGSEAPVFTDPEPVLVLPATPYITPATPVGAAPVIVQPVIPDAPTIDFPTMGALYPITLPPVPDITIPTFAGQRPDFDVPIPPENFSFTPPDFVNDLMTQTQAAISSMMAGNPLPPGVAQAIRDRAYADAYKEELRTVQTTYDEYAARGFFEPAGDLTRRVQEARDAAQKNRMGINRDVYIQDNMVAIENLRFAVTSGIQMEGQLIQLYATQVGLQFQAAKYAFDVAIGIFNARVTAFNAEVQLYTADAEVYRDLIQGALAQVQVYSAEIEGQRVVGELNQQLVQIYTAQLQAVNEMVEIYKAQLEGAETISRVNLANVQAFSAQVEAFSAEINAQATQWGAYKTQIDAQLGKAQFYSATVQAYGERVRAWQAGEQTKQAAVSLQLDQGKLSLEQWQARLAKFEELLKTELGRVQSVVSAYDAETHVYSAQAQVAEAAGEYDNRRFQLYMTQEQAIVDTELKRADLGFEQMKYITSVMLEIKKTLAQVQAQLAASAMSAVNIGASLSSSTSEAIDYSLGISYGGQMA